MARIENVLERLYPSKPKTAAQRGEPRPLTISAKCDRAPARQPQPTQDFYRAAGWAVFPLLIFTPSGREGREDRAEQATRGPDAVEIALPARQVNAFAAIGRAARGFEQANRRPLAEIGYNAARLFGPAATFLVGNAVAPCGREESRTKGMPRAATTRTPPIRPCCPTPSFARP